MVNEEEYELYPVDPDVIRFQLVKRMPYLRVPVYRLRPRPSKDVITFGVDAKWRWTYGEKAAFNQKGQVGALFHEVNHLLRGHHARTGFREHKGWNVATDFEINEPEKFVAMGIELPENLIRAEHMNLPYGKLAEWYYENLDQYELHVREDASANNPGKGKCSTSDSCDSKDRECKFATTGEVTQKGVMHTPVCESLTSQADGEESDKEQGYSDQPLSPVEEEAIRRAVAHDIERFHSQGIGTIPGSMLRWAEEYLHPKIPWTKILKRKARRASIIISGHTRRTFQQPARREYGDFILPKRVSTKVRASIYIDTSGSISTEELQQAVSEVRGALRSNLAELSVTFLDAQLYETRQVKSRGHLKLLVPKGGGGTDMRLAFDHASKMFPRPHLVIVLTDGYTPWPDEPPHGITSIICTTGSKETPEWAQRIVVDLKEETDGGY